MNGGLSYPGFLLSSDRHALSSRFTLGYHSNRLLTVTSYLIFR